MSWFKRFCDRKKPNIQLVEKPKGGGISFSADKARTLPMHPSKRYKIRRFDDVKKIVIHRCKLSDSTNFFDYKRVYGDTEEEVASFFVNEMGWPGFPYHYSINKDGSIHQCQPISFITYHVSGYNKEGVAIRLDGDFRTEEPTKAQFNSLVVIAGNLLELFSLEVDSVVRHNDFPDHKMKYCPGKNIDMAKLREEAGKYKGLSFTKDFVI